MVGTVQRPIPDNVMGVYKTMVMKREDGWELTIYCKDSFGRSWAAHTKIEEPQLLIGEPLAPNEIIEEDADG